MVTLAPAPVSPEAEGPPALLYVNEVATGNSGDEKSSVESGVGDIHDQNCLADLISVGNGCGDRGNIICAHGAGWRCGDGVRRLNAGFHNCGARAGAALADAIEICGVILARNIDCRICRRKSPDIRGRKAWWISPARSA